MGSSRSGWNVTAYSAALSQAFINMSISALQRNSVIPDAEEMSNAGSAATSSGVKSAASAASIFSSSSRRACASSRSSRDSSATSSFARTKICRAARINAPCAISVLLCCFRTLAIFSTLPKDTMACGVLIPPLYSARARAIPIKGIFVSARISSCAPLVIRSCMRATRASMSLHPKVPQIVATPDANRAHVSCTI